MPQTPSDYEGVQKGILDTNPHFEGITKKTNLELFVFDILTMSGTREVEASGVLADINFDPWTRGPASAASHSGNSAALTRAWRTT